MKNEHELLSLRDWRTSQSKQMYIVTYTPEQLKLPNMSSVDLVQYIVPLWC